MDKTVTQNDNGTHTTQRKIDQEKEGKKE